MGKERRRVSGTALATSPLRVGEDEFPRLMQLPLASVQTGDAEMYVTVLVLLCCGCKPA